MKEMPNKWANILKLKMRKNGRKFLWLRIYSFYCSSIFIVLLIKSSEINLRYSISQSWAICNLDYSYVFFLNSIYTFHCECYVAVCSVRSSKNWLLNHQKNKSRMHTHKFFYCLIVSFICHFLLLLHTQTFISTFAPPIFVSPLPLRVSICSSFDENSKFNYIDWIFQH